MDNHARLGTNGKLPTHGCGTSHWALHLLCWRGSPVQTGAELGSRPHSSQGIKRNPHLIITSLVPTRYFPWPTVPSGELRRQPKQPQSSPLLPPCRPPLSSWAPQCPHARTRCPASLSAAGTSPRSGGAPQLSTLATKGSRADLGPEGMGDSTDFLPPSPQYAQSWFI